jgi:hypothetical protein
LSSILQGITPQKTAIFHSADILREWCKRHCIISTVLRIFIYPPHPTTATPTPTALARTMMTQSLYIYSEPKDGMKKNMSHDIEMTQYESIKSY